MLVHSNIKKAIEIELKQAKSVWVASAMISHNGWTFLQDSIPQTATQFYLIGIDLATEPKVFESILERSGINARVYQAPYTFHPKVYLIQKPDESYSAFIGSSNTTNWGLEKNVEMNFKVENQDECTKILTWFNNLYWNGYLITEEFVEDYKARFVRTSFKVKEIEKEAKEVKLELTEADGQFFEGNQHEIFKKKYHRLNRQDLKDIRREVKDKFLELHYSIYPRFGEFGLTDLHCHHSTKEIVSRHYFNQYSGNYINAMWLHYGKSWEQLQKSSLDKEKSFINNVRMQVIIHEDSIGIWLILGKGGGSVQDREHFRNQMHIPEVRQAFFDAYKSLGKEYWINVPEMPSWENLITADQLWQQTQKEDPDDYFIIGCDIDWLDNRLKEDNIEETILIEFQKLYPLYEIMRKN